MWKRKLTSRRVDFLPVVTLFFLTHSGASLTQVETYLFARSISLAMPPGNMEEISPGLGPLHPLDQIKWVLNFFSLFFSRSLSFLLLFCRPDFPPFFFWPPGPLEFRIGDIFFIPSYPALFHKGLGRFRVQRFFSVLISQKSRLGCCDEWFLMG